MRRLRSNETLRRMVRETKVSPDDLILPLFVIPGEGQRKEVGAMPGVYQESVDHIVSSVGHAADVGIPAVLLFGIPETKNPTGSEAWNDDGVVQRASRAIKDKYGDRILVITDVCLCEYTDHGHCGVFDGHQVLNDETLPLLAQTAVSLAGAGADIVAPS